MNVESELKDIINRLYDIQDVSGPDLSKKIYEIILQCREAIGYRKAELDRVQSSRKPIKSFRNPSTEDTSNDYGFHWDGDNIYDKDGFHWYFGDYINNNDDPGIGPYSSYMQAVKETEDSIRDSFTEDEIPDPEDYAYQLVDFAVETLPDPGKFIKEYEGFVESSRKPIKSDSDWHARHDYQNKEIYREAFASLVKDSDAQDFDNSPYGTVHYPGFYRVLVDGTYETEFSAETDEEAIQKFKDYFAMSRGINNSRKSIKSSLEDRLIPYLEEFEEGYADALTSTDEMGNNARLDTFYEMFKSDYNLSDDDINKLEGAVQDIWHETEEENAEHDMGEMYGAPHGATPEEALKVFESKKPIKSGSMSGYFSGICDKCKQFTNVHYVGYNGRKLCMRCSRGR